MSRLFRPQALAAAAALVSHAAMATTLPLPETLKQVVLSGAVSVAPGAANDTHDGGSPVSGSAATGTATVGGFNASLGVLTGASLSGSSTGQVTAVSAKAWGTASVTDRLAASGGFGQVQAQGSVTTSAGGDASAAIGTFGQSAYAGNLGDLLGRSSSFEVSSATSANKEGGSGSFKAESASHSITAAISYDYLRHANASFNALADVNSSTMTVGQAAGSSFSIFARGDSNTTRLDQLGTVSCTGDCAAFNLSWAALSDLNANGSASGTARLISTVAGQHSATYSFRLGDDTSIGVGQTSETLSFTLNGTVAAVPEPESYAMFLAGLLALTTVSRRRRSS